MDREIFLTGDFKLGVDANALEILGCGLNLRNLIQGNKINSASKLYQKPNKFANYTLVSNGLKIQKFESPCNEISDHLPIVTDFTFRNFRKNKKLIWF